MKGATMPNWTFCVSLGVLAACAPASGPAPPTPSRQSYTAHGQEPGWSLTIANDQIVYLGNYGDTHITVPAPEPRPTINGHRYETERLIVDITHGRCNDAMSGQGFADQVLVIADGKTYRGCGGTRRSDWDI
jgi:heat shock protein HslJ